MSSKEPSASGTRCLECELSEACFDDDFERARRLLAQGAQAQANKDCNTALHDALTRQNLRLTRLLLEHGADPDRTAPTTSKRPLLLAIESGRPELCTLLLEHEAQPELVSWWDLVAGSDNPELIRSALVAQLDPNNPTPEDGTTALHVAAMYGYLESLDLLLRSGADPTHRDAHGNTPADLARRNHHLEAAQRLEAWTDS